MLVMRNRDGMVQLRNCVCPSGSCAWICEWPVSYCSSAHLPSGSGTNPVLGLGYTSISDSWVVTVGVQMLCPSWPSYCLHFLRTDCNPSDLNLLGNLGARMPIDFAFSSPSSSLVLPDKWKAGYALWKWCITLPSVFCLLNLWAFPDVGGIPHF